MVFPVYASERVATQCLFKQSLEIRESIADNQGNAHDFSTFEICSEMLLYLNIYLQFRLYIQKQIGNSNDH